MNKSTGDMRALLLTIMVPGVLAGMACESSSAGVEKAEAAARSVSAPGSKEVPVAPAVKASDALMQRTMGTSKDVPEIVQRALGRAELPLSDADRARALEIYRAGGGETGRGKLHVAYATGFGENAWRRVAFMEFVLQALSYPDVARISYASARFDTSKAISDIQSFVAQGVDVLVVYADHREAVLPTLREATEAGIRVVPWSATPGGEPGKDYLSFVGNDVCKVGAGFAEYAISKTAGKGSYVELGGTPGNAYTASWQKCAEEVYARSPGMKQLGKADTMWTQEGAFKEASAFLARESKIDVWNYAFADGARGIVRAYEAAGRPLDFALTVAGDEQGLFGDYERLRAKNPDLRIFHGPGGTFQIRVALSVAMEGASGQAVPASVNVPAVFKEYQPGRYNKDLPDEMPMSALVPMELMASMFGKAN